MMYFFPLGPNLPMFGTRLALLWHIDAFLVHEVLFFEMKAF